MSESAITHPIETLRGIEHGNIAFGSAWRPFTSMKGASWIDDGFDSTTTKPSVATTFARVYESADSGNVVLRITSPAGIHAVTFSPSSEQEILLDRGLKYTVTDDYQDPAFGGRVLEVTTSQPTPEEHQLAVAGQLGKTTRKSSSRFIDSGPPLRIVSMPDDDPVMIKVGPHGYVHGWHFVGIPLEGDEAYKSVKLPRLSPAEQKARNDYGYTKGYTTVNPYLHHDGQVFDTSVMKYQPATPAETRMAEGIISGMDGAFSKAGPLKQPIITHRGSGNMDDMFGPVGSRVGESFTARAYTSTTTVPDAKVGYGLQYETKPGRITVGIPAGSRVLPGNDFEHEIILPRNARFSVVSDEMSGSQRHVRLEYQP
jgi:hypothetical protein